MAIQLEKEFQYYVDNQSKLVKSYSGKFLVIKNQKIIGVYDSQVEAYQQTLSSEKEGTFLIQECRPGTGSYRQIFHSRVTVRS